MSAPYLQARYTITSVVDQGGTPQEWELDGYVADAAFGFSPYDVQVGDLIFDESVFDFVVNRWTITQVVAAGSPNWDSLKVRVKYAQKGTPAGLFGEPQACDAALCRIPVDGWQVAQRPTQGWAQLSETLLNYIRNIDLYEIQERIDSGGLKWVTISNNATAKSGYGYRCDVSGGSITVTLPASPADGAYVVVYDVSGYAGTNPITIDANGSNINGDTGFVIDTDYTSVHLNFTEGYGWTITNLLAGKACT